MIKDSRNQLELGKLNYVMVDINHPMNFVAIQKKKITKADKLWVKVKNTVYLKLV